MQNLLSLPKMSKFSTQKEMKITYKIFSKYEDFQKTRRKFANIFGNLPHEIAKMTMYTIRSQQVITITFMKVCIYTVHRCIIFTK